MAPNPPSPRLVAELEKRFIDLVCAKNALLLRQTAIATDIGIALELLTLQLQFYLKDTATLASVYEDINSVKQELAASSHHIRFYALEYLPSSSPYDSSLLEKVQETGREAQPSFDRYKASRAAGLRFMKDPQALLEGRLGIFSSSQR